MSTYGEDLVEAMRRYTDHTDACVDAVHDMLRKDPSATPTCTCGLDALRAAPTLTDLLRYVDSYVGRNDCYHRTDLRWHEGNPIDRAGWFERLVRGFAEGKLDRDFRYFWESERFHKLGGPDDLCASCGLPKREHSSDPPYRHFFRDGCDGFRLAQKDA